MQKNMGQNTKVDDSGAFARFQRGKELFKEKNKVEIRLDRNYNVAEEGGDDGKSDAAKGDAAKGDAARSDTMNSNTAKSDTANNNTANNNTAKNDTTKSDHVDENGWTQSQQRALEKWEEREE